MSNDFNEDELERRFRWVPVTKVRTKKQKERLDRAIGRLVIDPSSWDQHTWGTKNACGTVACLAGSIAIHDGLPITWIDRHFSDGISLQSQLDLYLMVDLGDGETYETQDFSSHVGQNHLGIEREVADTLFSASNSLEDILTVIRWIESKEAELTAAKNAARLKRAAKAAK